MLTAGRPVSPPQYGQNPARYVSCNQSRSMSVPRIYYTRYAPRTYRELSPEATIAYLQFHLAPEYDGDYSLQQDASYRPPIECISGKTTVGGWEQMPPGAVTTRHPPTYSTPSRQQPPISAAKHDQSARQFLLDKSGGFSSRPGVSTPSGGPELSARMGSANQQHLAGGGLSPSYQTQGASAVETSHVSTIAVHHGHPNNPIQAGGVASKVPHAGLLMVAEVGSVTHAEKLPFSPHKPSSPNQQGIGDSLPERSYYAGVVPQQGSTPNRQPLPTALQSGVNYYGQVVGHTNVAQGRETQAISTTQQSSLQKSSHGGHSQQAVVGAASQYLSAQKSIAEGLSPQAAIAAASQHPSVQKPSPGGYSPQVAIATASPQPLSQKPAPGTPGGYSPQAMIGAASQHSSAQKPSTGGYSQQAAITAASEHSSAQKYTAGGYSQQAANALTSQQPSTQKPVSGGHSQQAAIAAASPQVGSQSPNQQYSTGRPDDYQHMGTMSSRAGGPAQADQHRQQQSGPASQTRHPTETRPTNSSTGWTVDKQIVTTGRAPAQQSMMGNQSQQAPASESTHLSRSMGDAPRMGSGGAKGIHGGASIADERQQAMTGGQPSPVKNGQALITGVNGIYGPGWVLDQKMPTSAQRQQPQYNQMSASMPAPPRQSRLDQGTAKAATNNMPSAQHRSLSLPRIYYTRYSPRSYRELSPQATVAYLQYNEPMMESDY